MASPPPEKPAKPYKSSTLTGRPRQLTLDRQLLLSESGQLISGRTPLSPTYKQCLRLRLQKALSASALKGAGHPLRAHKEAASLPPSPISPLAPASLKIHSSSLDEVTARKDRCVIFFVIFHIDPLFKLK